jgi:LDH2 family malate/lactate/ureidoglycolate dehydrogenase
MQNGPPIMGLPGATKPAIGNNPLAFAMPVADGPSLVFDMAASEAAFGRIIDAARNNQPIPSGWAIDETGAETTDAAAAMRGMLLPTGAFKGVGIAMLVECLAGSLSGVYLEKLEPGRTLPPSFGAFLLVINPALLIGADAFAAHRDTWLDRYKSSSKSIRYPGERAAQVEAQRSRDGIPLPATVVQQLTQLGESVGAPWVLGGV